MGSAGHQPLIRSGGAQQQQHEHAGDTQVIWADKRKSDPHFRLGRASTTSERGGISPSASTTTTTTTTRDITQVYHSEVLSANSKGRQAAKRPKMFRGRQLSEIDVRIITHNSTPRGAEPSAAERRRTRRGSEAAERSGRLKAFYFNWARKDQKQQQP